MPDRSKREVEIVESDFQPSKAEMEEDVRMDATFDDAVDMPADPVEIRYVSRRRGRSFEKSKDPAFLMRSTLRTLSETPGFSVSLNKQSLRSR